MKLEILEVNSTFEVRCNGVHVESYEKDSTTYYLAPDASHIISSQVISTDGSTLLLHNGTRLLPNDIFCDYPSVCIAMRAALESKKHSLEQEAGNLGAGIALYNRFITFFERVRAIPPEITIISYSGDHSPLDVRGHRGCFVGASEAQTLARTIGRDLRYDGHHMRRGCFTPNTWILAESWEIIRSWKAWHPDREAVYASDIMQAIKNEADK